MEPINLLRYLITRSKTKNIMTSHMAVDILRASNKPKFLLPHKGKILDLDYKLKGVPEYIRLPYDEFIVEYISEMHKDDLVSMLTEDKIPNKYAGLEWVPTNELLVVTQLDSGIQVRAVTLISGDNPNEEIWLRPPFKGMLGNKRNITPPKGQAGIDIYLDENDPEYLDSPAKDVDKELFGRMFKFVMIRPMMAILELVAALDCSNVREESIPARKVNKGAMKRGALPFDSYKILTVVPNGKTNNSKLGIPIGDRHSPREHLRIGHIRTYSTGLKVWINQTVVNAGIGNVVDKDYRIKKGN